jgi:patatin-related protein
MSNPSPTNADYTQEVRFAVVMYGGVSLAIYINGIAQELLRLVRATARGRNAAGGPPIEGTERIYRQLSYLLADERNGLDQVAEENAVGSVPPTRFVVDILSGTSAGGINGIFLAKALANGQDIQRLQELWVQEGDIETLINDKRSIERPLSLQEPPPSLLNSERMYFELLKAFQGMDKETGERTSQDPSPYVDELDLFVTSTDLQGVVLPIRLSDELVYERRHRNVMHFVYSSPTMSGEDEIRNDFRGKYNPFLAYAARCTSSFPFAFEPMCLCDTDKLLNKLPEYQHDKNCKSTSGEWQKFYRDYLDPRGVLTVKFPQRAFGDGGYLDNKPFSYATETLMNRNADVPVDRKLIYIEPSPEHPEDEVDKEGKPDAIENVVSALLTLPRYETIREDLQRVRDRNRLIERVNAITAGVYRDARSIMRGAAPANSHAAWLEFGAIAPVPTESLWAKQDITDEEVGQLDLGDMIKRKGRAYAGYHRLRISAVTDELARLIARVAGFDENSDYFIVVRNMVRAWRVRTYVDHRSGPDDPRWTSNRFLYDFDLSYPIRRVNYLRAKADSLYRFDKNVLDLIRDQAEAFNVSFDEEKGLPEREKEIFRQTLLESKQTLNNIFIRFRSEARSLRSRHSAKDGKVASNAEAAQNASVAREGQAPGPADNGEPEVKASPVNEQVMALISEIDKTVRQQVRDKESPTAVLDYFLGKRELADHKTREQRSYKAETPEDECAKRSLAFLIANPEVMRLFEIISDALKAKLKRVKDKAEQRSQSIFLSENTDPSSPDPLVDRVIGLARACLGHYYNNYEDHDLLTYPILYDTDVGEADTIDIIRISPEDARQLLDERKTGCHKLAGSALGHFGAFLQKLWRQNDILWGRLDGAERIITALIPNHPSRTTLIGEAHAEIVYETIARMDETERFELLSEALMRTRTRKAEPELLDSFINRLLDNCSGNPALRTKLEGLINQQKLRGYYRENFATHSQVEPENALRSLARSTTVIGRILEGSSSSRRINTKYALWIARLGRIFWALVEVAVPRSFPNLFFNHWLKLVYFLEVLLIVGSTLLLNYPIQQFALTAFGITAAIHLAVTVLGDLIESRNRWLNLAKAVGLVLLVIVILTGGLTLSAILGWDSAWFVLTKARDWFVESVDWGWNSKSLVRAALTLFVVLVFLWSIRKDLMNFRKARAEP